jgi:Cdc6-like AAA superfamily ATPase
MFSVLVVVHDLTTLAVANDITEIATNIKETGEGIQRLRLNQHEREIRDWLSAPEPSINYENALEKRHKGTGVWFTGGQAFADWKKQSNTFLWLHGIPGCGKTVLSSTIIEHLESVTRPAQVLLYFYFDFNDKKKQNFENMLRTLVNQLYQGQPSARGPLDQLQVSTKHLSKASLKEVLLAMLSKVNNVSIILDALDESTTRSDLLAWLRDVLETDSCRILVTARREEDIESALRRWMRPEDKISIEQDDISEDIRAYVGHTVRSSEELVRWHERPEVQDEIETELVKKAGGM